MPHVRPAKLADALTLLDTDQWSILSGGTDFYPSLRDQVVQGKVLDLWQLDELRGFQQEQDYLRIGALTTWSDIVNEPLPEAFDGLKLAAREVGSVQIQNRGTLAGNICNASPAADGVPPLLILDAIVEVTSSLGSRCIPLHEFILGNRKTALQANELVSALLIPTASMKGQSSFVKLGSRRYLVISISMVAARLECNEQAVITDAAVCVGSCSLIAQRLSKLENALVGQSVQSEFTRLVDLGHLTDLSPIDDIRATGQYRLEATGELIKRALSDAGGKCL